MGGTLHPQQLISHYRIVGPLGAGGMGEVYLAQDLTLERNVALKILPPSLVADEERVRRFTLEAKSASSLSHPNIVTIHEIGEADLEPASTARGEAAVPPVRFIAMELISGRTLGDIIHRDRADVRTLLGYLAQAAQGLAKAHGAGIVHRDLKPGNIMVTGDGYTKVLDFGLAKLTESRCDSEDETIAPAETRDDTSAGIVLGTVGYMSPEQVAGKGVDQRSDIFSFGCILYEAATRQRAFSGATAVETMHRILKEKPRPIDEINPSVPADLRRLIRRCLAKDPEQRYHSMKDIAIDLREIADEYDSLSASASSGSSAVLPAGPRRGRYGVLAAGVLLVGVAVVGTWLVATRANGPGASADNLFAAMRITRIAGGSDIREPVMSPDGKYLAYVKTIGTQVSVHVRQIATGSDVQIVEPQAASMRSLSFAPNGDYVYYLARDRDAPQYSALFEVPTLGGSPRRRVSDVDSAACFSPDGRRMAFLRGVTTENSTRLMLVDWPSGTERVLAEVKNPEQTPFGIAPVWSPDGRRIAVVIDDPLKVRVLIAAFDAESGVRSTLDVWNGAFIASIAWLPSGKRLAVGSNTTMNNTQVWEFSDGQKTPRRVTNDQETYTKISASADGLSFALARSSRSSTVWNVSASGGEPRQIPIGETDSYSLAVADDGSIVLTAPDRAELLAFRNDGSGVRHLTPANLQVYSHWLIPRANATLFIAYGSDGIGHMWRADLDGGNLRQLTRGAGEYVIYPSTVSPDGRLALYRGIDRRDEVWQVPVSGGPATRLVSGLAGDAYYGGFSGDGSLVALGTTEAREGRVFPAIRVVRAGSGELVNTLRGIDGVEAEWIGQEHALSFLREQSGVDTLLRWSVEGGGETPLIALPGLRVAVHQWAPDSRSVVFRGGSGTVWNLYRWTVGSKAPEQITHFPTGRIFDVAWAPDGKSIYFTQGTVTQDIALLRPQIAQ